MTQEEINIRSVYLLLACSKAVDRVRDRLVDSLPDQLKGPKTLIDQCVKRELGLLFRYWTTRQIWEQMEDNEAEAKNLNLSLLRLFTSTFKLPRDGSGLKYAELSSLSEEAQELSRRLAGALNIDPHPLLTGLEETIAPWREAVVEYTAEALALPVEQLATRIKEWEQWPDKKP